MGKRKKLATPAPTRRSTRVKALPQVNYDGDWEMEHFGKRRKVGAKNEQVAKVVASPSSRKSPRELPSVDYGLMDRNMDDEIFCNGCKKWVVPPCSLCGECSEILDPSDPKLNLVVVESKVSGAGEGLFNKGPTISKGTLVGPYTGKFISYADYKHEEKKGQESGYAWLIYESENMKKPYGYIDPGSAPDPTLNKLAKANHPSKKWEQSFVGCQYKGKIYYRAIKDVLQFQEVFVDYGPEYAAELGIDAARYDTYTRPENHKTSAIPCPICETTFSSQNFLDVHMKRCRKKVPCVKNQRPVGGRIKCIDPSCDKTFAGPKRTNMFKHFRAEHLDKKFPCTSCNKVFTRSDNMQQHYRDVHLGEAAFKCITCGQLFNRNSALKKHVEEVHLGKRPFICGDCGATFAQQTHLKTHISVLHSTDRPQYPCTDCSKTFVTSAGLKQHQLSHTAELFFNCTYESCNKSFKTQLAVNRHIKTSKKHAGDRLASTYLLPFSCQAEGCVNRYETEEERDRHMEKLHPKL